jgi:superoxide dismutase, Fe-Mn family
MNPSKPSCSALPYRFDALEPVLSRKTVQRHFQHQRRLSELALAATRGTAFESLSLEALAQVTAFQPRHRGLCALATKAWNHDLYWRSLRAGAGGEAWGPIGNLIRSSFNGFETFARRMKQAASELLGSGWLWATWRSGAIEVLTTRQAHSPFKDGHVPLLAIDLWEHAYHPDYDYARDVYVSACLRYLIDWAGANERLLQIGAAREALSPGKGG